MSPGKWEPVRFPTWISAFEYGQAMAIKIFSFMIKLRSLISRCDILLMIDFYKQKGCPLDGQPVFV
jgi:hypothetical protein